MAVTLIGDVVASRAAADRSALHRALLTALGSANDQLVPLTPLRITVGDEYQGVFVDLADAVRASLALQLRLAPLYEVRHGIGWGQVAELQADPRVEDGPGWWAARAAIEAVHDAQQHRATRWRRTAFRVADEPDADRTLQGAVEAGLILRDRAFATLDERDLSVLDGLLAGRSQRQVAAELGISASAVSQRIRGGALGALVAADEIWREVAR